MASRRRPRHSSGPSSRTPGYHSQPTPELIPGFTKTLHLGQDVVRFLKTTKIAEEAKAISGACVTFTHAGQGNYNLEISGNQQQLVHAEQTVNQRVGELCTRSFPLDMELLQYLVTIKHVDVIGKLREARVWAGWSVNVEHQTLDICSSNVTNASKAHEVLMKLIRDGKLNERFISRNQPELQYDVEVVRYLHAKGVIRDANKRYNVQTDINFTEGLITVKGDRESVDNATGFIQTTVASLECDSMQLSRSQSQTLKCIPANNAVAALKERRIFSGWDIQDEELFVCTNSRENAQKAMSILMGLVESVDEGSSKNSPRRSRHSSLNDGDFRDTLRLDVEKLRYFKAAMDEDLKAKLKVSLSVNLGACFIEVSGDRQHVFNAIEELDLLAEGFFLKSSKKSDIFVKCLMKIKNKEVIEALRAAQIKAGWDVRDGELWICSDCQSHATKAENAICSLITESVYPQKVELSTQQRKTIATDPVKWSTLVSDMQKQNPNLQLDVDDASSKVIFALPSGGNKLSISHSLEQFFSPVQLQTLEIPLRSTVIMELLKKNQSTIEVRFSQRGEESVTMSFANKNCRLQSNTQKSLYDARKCLKSVISGLVTRSKDFSKLALVTWLQSSNGDKRLAEISEISRTVYEVPPVKRNAAPSNLDRMDVMIGDISTIPAEGILTGRGSLCQAMEKASGTTLKPGLQMVQLKNGLNPHVYHIHDIAQWKDESSLNKLRCSLVDALRRFSATNLQTIALPILGTGNFNFPSKRVVDMMTTTVLQYMDSNSQTSLCQVYFIAYQDDEVFQSLNAQLSSLKAALLATDTPAGNLTVSFTGLTDADADKALTSLQTDLEALLVVDKWTKSPHKSVIRKLSPLQVVKLKDRAKRLNIDITIDLSASDITIEGLKDDVSDLRDEINIVLHSLAGAQSAVPSHWQHLAAGQWKVPLSFVKDQDEIKRVITLFYKTCPSSVKLQKIYRVQNEHLYAQYQAQKDKITKELAGTGITVERELWHGTDGVTVDSICTQEFNRSYAGRNAVAYGKGSYFSATSEYSVRYGGDHMILAKVLTGKYKLGNKSVERRNLPQGVHSSVNSESAPSIFVVYHDAAAYPEYILKFTAGFFNVN